MELDLEAPLSQKDLNFHLESHVQSGSYKAVLSILSPKHIHQCPRCNTPETTIHILRDCPWAKEA